MIPRRSSRARSSGAARLREGAGRQDDGHLIGLVRHRRKTHRVHEQAHLAQVPCDVEVVAQGPARDAVAMVRHGHRLEGGVRPPRADLTHRRGRVGGVRAQPRQQRRGQLLEHLRRKRGVGGGRRRVPERGTATAGRGKLLLFHETHGEQTLKGLAHARHVQASLLGQLRHGHGRRMVRNAFQQSVCCAGRQRCHCGERFSQRPSTGGITHDVSSLPLNQRKHPSRQSPYGIKLVTLLTNRFILPSTSLSRTANSMRRSY